MMKLFFVVVFLLFFRDCLLTRLPHLKFIKLGSLRLSHLPFKMQYVGNVRLSLTTHYRPTMPFGNRKKNI